MGRRGREESLERRPTFGLSPNFVQIREGCVFPTDLTSSCQESMLFTPLLGEQCPWVFHAHPAAQQPSEPSPGSRLQAGEGDRVVWEGVLRGMGKMADSCF